MTISTTDDPVAGPFDGNDSQTVFPFTFKVFANGDLKVVTRSGSVDATLVLDSDYSVTLNADQNANPGGSVTYPISGTPLATGDTLTISSNLSPTQPTSIPNRSGFFPQVIEDALDRCVMLIKQATAGLSRSLRFPLSDFGVNTELPSASDRALKILTFDAEGNPICTAPADGSAGALAADLAVNDSATRGANMVGASATTAATSGTVQAKLFQIVSITDHPFLAVSGADNTSAIASALAAADHVYVPDGTFYSTNAALEYWRCFGRGELRVGNRIVELTPYPRTGQAGQFFNERTFGNYDNACALSVTANSTAGQARTNTQLTGTDAQGIASSYKSFDHAAAYIAAYSYAATVTTAGSTTYTATTITAPEISTTSVKPGMFIHTNHASNGYVGQVESVSGTTATVVAWYTWTTGVAATPANGTSAQLNPNTKVWGLNLNTFITATGDATAGVGVELGLKPDKTGSGANTWGFDCVNLNGAESYFAGYVARGDRTNSFYSFNSGTCVYAFFADSPQVGFEAHDCSTRYFAALKSSVQKWNIDSNGALSGDYGTTVFNAAATYTLTEATSTLVNVSGGADITLPAVAGKTHRRYTIVAQAATNVRKPDGVTLLKALAAGATGVCVCDGSFWY